MGVWNLLNNLGRSLFGHQKGVQNMSPLYFGSLNEPPISETGAMQISAEYACVKLVSSVVASLPLMVYQNNNGLRTPIDRRHRLWRILHENPNDALTTYEFWSTMISVFMLRGNAFAQIVRDADGELVGLYVLNADQMKVEVSDTGRVLYKYTKEVGGKRVTVEMKPEEVLHIKDIGNGYAGLSKMEFMNASLVEAKRSQEFATHISRELGKPSGVLSVPNMQDDDQARETANAIIKRFLDGGRLMVLETDVKFSQLNLTPEQAQLLDSRKFGIEEICRWNGVPPILIGAQGASTWGTGISEIMSGFYKLTLAPLLKNLEQAIALRVMTDEEREKYTVEFNLDALLRGDIKTRYEAYSIAVRNGLKTRNEIRQLENDSPMPNGDELTAEANLVPLHAMGYGMGEKKDEEAV